MKIGVIAPTFRNDAGTAVEYARRVDGSSLDGIFVFDHLWPMGRPDRPAVSAFPVLGAIAAATRRCAVGTLVARVGLVPDAMLAHEFATLARIAGDRLIAGLGTGDSLSAAENEAFGVEFGSVEERVASLGQVAARLRDLGTVTWIGGRSPEVRAVAARTGDALNVWGVDATVLAQEAADVQRLAGDRSVVTTWGGQVLIGSTAADAQARLAEIGPRPGLVHGSIEQVAGSFSALAAAGATWAVGALLQPDDPDVLDFLAEVHALVSSA